MTDRTGYSLERTPLDMDSLIHVFTNLSISEKVKCRLVCKSWRTAVDKLFSGQKSLNISFNNNKRKNNYFVNYSELETNDNIVSINPLNTYKTRKQIKFQSFHQMMSKFPSVETLVLIDLALNDIIILLVTNTLRQLSSLTLISSTAKQNYYNNNDINRDRNQITSYGWKLLTNSYGHSLKQLTIRNTTINDEDCETILLGFPYLTYLDLADNEWLNGTALHLLGSECFSLCVGSLTTARLWTQPIVQSLSQSNARLKRLQLRGGINQQLSAIKCFKSLEELSVRFFCPPDQTFDTLSPVSNLLNLRKLSLYQEQCYDEPSAIDGNALMAIASGCPLLTDLVISGEYGWKLRLNDTDIKHLVNKCPLIQHICLTGNSSAVTDTGAQHLLALTELRSVSLTSFDRITDEGVIPLIVNCKELQHLSIRETSSITKRTLFAAIEVAKTAPNRRLSIYLAETSKVVKPETGVKIPDNLKIVFEENLRSRKQSDEPSAMKMMAVVGMSAVILAMIIITMLVVLIMPIGMLLMIFYENCVDYVLNSDLRLNRDNPLNFLHFYDIQAIRHLTSDAQSLQLQGEFIGNCT